MIEGNRQIKLAFDIYYIVFVHVPAFIYDKQEMVQLSG